MKHALRAAHFPQHIDIDRALAAGDVERAAHLLHGALDGVLNQLFMAFATRERVVDLGDDLALGIVAVGVYRRNRADAAGRCPRAGAGVVGRRDALAPFHQRPNFAAVIDDRLQALEHISLQLIQTARL